MEQKYTPKLTKLPPPKELIPIKDIETLKKTKTLYENKLLVVLFWKKDNEPAMHMKGVCDELAKVSEFTQFISVPLWA